MHLQIIMLKVDWNTKAILPRSISEVGKNIKSRIINGILLIIFQEIDGPSLLLMRREDVLSTLGIKLGPALKIYVKVKKIQQYSQGTIAS